MPKQRFVPCPDCRKGSKKRDRRGYVKAFDSVTGSTCSVPCLRCEAAGVLAVSGGRAWGYNKLQVYKAFNIPGRVVGVSSV